MIACWRALRSLGASELEVTRTTPWYVGKVVFGILWTSGRDYVVTARDMADTDRRAFTEKGRCE